jgi:hypothetical protein
MIKGPKVAPNLHAHAQIGYSNENLLTTNPYVSDILTNFVQYISKLLASSAKILHHFKSCVFMCAAATKLQRFKFWRSAAAAAAQKNEIALYVPIEPV